MVFLPALVVVAAAGAPQLLAPSGMQLIGRFRTSGSAVDFDMPGCEIRAILQLTKASEVSLKLAQRHSPVPPGSGNTKNSGFEANAFVVWVDGQRLGRRGVAVADPGQAAERRVPVCDVHDDVRLGATQCLRD